MFSFRSFIQAHRPQSDDELISAYIDGQLDERVQRAFETRIAAEPALRRRVEATRTLVQTARAMPESRAPRNFTLPRNMGAPAPATSQQLRVWWRLGSAVAAAVFVFAVGLDVSGVTRVPQNTLQQPVTATQPGISTESGATSAGAAVTESAEAGNASPKVAPPTSTAEANQGILPAQSLAAPTGTPEVAAPPSILSAPVETGTQPITAGAAAIAPQPTATEQSVADAQRLSNTGVTSETSEITSLSEPTGTSVPPVVPAPATAAATIAAYAAQQPGKPAPAVDWLGVVAALAFALAVILGIAGWVRR